MRQTFASLAVKSSPAALAAACSLVLLAGCDKKPEGQVAAVMNGKEITLQEVNLALGDAGAAQGDNKALRQAALQNVINRKLAAQLARDEGIDETPEYIVREQQVKDGLLMQMLAQKLSRALKQPSSAELDKFIADNPNIFDKRAILVADQIRFAPTQDKAVLDGLKAAKSMEEVTSVLDSKGLRFERGTVQIDTANLPLAVVTQVEALPAGEPFVVPGGGFYTVNVLQQTKPVPITGEKARPVALSAYQQRALNQEIEKRMKAAREKAKIDYQKGLEPPAAKASGGAVAAKP